MVMPSCTVTLSAPLTVPSVKSPVSPAGSFQMRVIWPIFASSNQPAV